MLAGVRRVVVFSGESFIGVWRNDAHRPPSVMG